MVRLLFPTFAAAIGLFSAAPIAAEPTDADRTEARALLKTLVAIPTAKGRGQVPALIDVLETNLTSAGFSKDDIVRRPVTIDGEVTMGLIVRYKGSDPKARPVALLAHMDVVDAVKENWATDPYTPVEKQGYLYGRGTQDNKFGVAVLTTSFMRLKRLGWLPERDLFLAFSGDEETGMLSTRAVIAHPWIKRADYALNSDAGGGSVTPDGKPIAFGMQAAEKTNATFLVTAANRGGHSSVPRTDNAIYDLARALSAIETLRFPVNLNEVTRGMVARAAAEKGGELGAALTTLLRDPSNKAAIAVTRRYPETSNILWTTCVATMLKAGNAPNALPQNASATVNCRILPGTKVADVQTTIAGIIANPAMQVRLEGEAVESPVSPIRPDVVAALQLALSGTYEGARLAPVMSSGGTEGREYRRAGIPTYGAGSLGLVLPEDSRAHGTDERIPLAAFDRELNYWEILLKAAGGARSAKPN
ncbi:M20/M25/M40 family metallo-hydrolase [uncultured Sphingomonas sp.]|uniref:M20/M25/M40 family metallo-hydrolase n=1 Tax=uncultured Sphingomonas sp. TaxID=158754 RepID=UPI0035CA35A4